MERKLISRDECKNIQVYLLEFLDIVCREYGLKYYLAYGTLLGAVRHKGFIPWDDDIDVFLMREDYEKLISLFQTKLLDDKRVFLLDGRVRGYYYPFAKLVDKSTVAKMEDNLTSHGIWIDIFPMDVVPEEEKKCERFLKTCTLLRATILSMTTDFHSQKLGKKYIPKKVLSVIASLIGKEKIYNAYINYIRKYEGKEEKYVACLSSPYIKKEKVEKRLLEEQQSFEFEGRTFTGPKNWDLYLKRLYGNYMELPPEKKRRIHSITAWKLDSNR